MKSKIHLPPFAAWLTLEQCGCRQRACRFIDQFPQAGEERKVTESIEILRMNIQHYEGLLRLTQDEGKRQQIERLLAETRGELKSAEKALSPKR